MRLSSGRVAAQTNRAVQVRKGVLRALGLSLARLPFGCQGRSVCAQAGSVGLSDVRAHQGQRGRAEGAAGKRHFGRTPACFLLQQVVFWYILFFPLKILSFMGEKKCVGFQEHLSCSIRTSRQSSPQCPLRPLRFRGGQANGRDEKTGALLPTPSSARL